MANFLAVGDIHYKTGNKDQTDRLEQLVLDQLEGLDFVILLGDVLHDFSRVYTRVKSRTISFIRELANILPTYVIIGNHDFVNNQQYLTDNHAFEGIEIENTTFVSKPTHFSYSGKRFLAIPYVPVGKLDEVVDPHMNDVNLVFAHQELYGADIHSGVESEADEWKYDVPIISGHIHRPQVVGEFVIYSGASIQTNFGETWDTSVVRGKLSNRLKYERISTTITGRLLTVRLRAIDLFNNVWPECHENDKIRLQVEGLPEELKRLKRDFKDKLKGYDKVMYINLRGEIPATNQFPQLNTVDDMIGGLAKRIDNFDDDHREIFLDCTDR